MDELDIVSRVELRFLLANDSSKFSDAIDSFLVPLLKKLKSPRVDVVRKVLDILHFIKKEKHDAPALAIPLAKLLDLYKSSVFDADPGTLRQNSLTLSFIGLALTPASPQLLADLAFGLRVDADGAAPDVAHGNAAHQFALFLAVLNDAVTTFPKEQLVMSQWDDADVAVLSRRLAQFFFLDLRQYAPTALPNLAPEDAAFFLKYGARVGVTHPLTDERLYSQTKKSILAFASANPEPLKHVLVAASGDKLLDVSRQAHAQVLNFTDFDVPLLQQWALRGNDILRAEVIEILLRRRLLSSFDPDIVSNAFQSGDIRLRSAALQLLKEALLTTGQQWPETALSRFNAMIQQYIVDDGWPRSFTHGPKMLQIRQQCYELLGVLHPSPETVNFLFQSLERDTTENAPSIQKSLSRVLDSSNLSVDPSKLLSTMLYSGSNRTRYMAVQFAAKRLEPSNPVQRVIFLLGLDPKENGSDVTIEAKRGLQSPVEDLPSFGALLDAARTTLITRFTAVETVNGTLFFLLACLLRWPTEGKDWIVDLETALTYTDMGASLIDRTLTENTENTKSFLAIVFPLLFSRTYFESVVFICRSLVFSMSQSLRETLAIDSNSLENLLSNEKSTYGTLLAELLPLLAPNLKIEGEGKLQVLAQAYRAATWGTDVEATTRAALSTKNTEAIQLLAISNNIDVTSELVDSMADSQLALACLSTYAAEDDQQKVLGNLLDRDLNSFDDLVANGEAISVATSGWASKVLHEKYPYLRSKYASDAATLAQRASVLREKALVKIVSGIKGSPKSRRASAVRLLCLTQYSFYDIDQLPGIAAGIQKCFMNLLSDPDHVTQESAGRGLGILFENGANDKDLQRNLLITLTTSFTDDDAAKKMNAGTLTSDTQIFEPGVLPAAPQGSSSISTYKDVLSLANESGDNSLVYKFMSLSSSSQIWSGRKGIAFSLESILAKSELGKQILDGSQLGNNLIAKLYRYLHDPIQVTREAMEHIWSALVPNSERSRIIKLYLPYIHKELSNGCINREWRVRQASATAFSSLISQGYVDHSVELWQYGFRLVDDIKESVRTAGSDLVKTLTQSLLRASSKNTTATDLTHIIPFLLKGLYADSTRKYSLETLLELSKTDGFQPWAAQVLEELTLQLSSLEPQAMNYLALNTSQSLVDGLRVHQLRESPIMRSLEDMVERGTPRLDEMWSLLPRIVKNSVGVVSQLAASRLLVLCCVRTYGAEKPASESLLNASCSQLWGVNELVSFNYASTLGYLCRQLPLSAVIKYVTELRVKFASSDSDEHTLRIVGAALKGLSNNASDVFAAVNKSTLPLAFLGQYAMPETSKNDFKDVWEGNTGGSAALRLYRSEITQLALDMLQKSTSHLMQVAAAKALTVTLAQIRVTNSDDNALVESLLTNLAGRSWPGKEHLFETLVAAATITDSSLLSKVSQRVIDEVKRRNEEYKLAILPSAAKYLREHRDDSLSGEIEARLAESLLSVLDGDNDAQSKAFKEVLIALDREDLIAKIEGKALTEMDSWKLRLEACLAFREKPFEAQSFTLLADKCANDQSHEIVRLEWVRTASAFRTEPIVRQILEERLSQETSTVIVAELKKALE